MVIVETCHISGSESQEHTTPKLYEAIAAVICSEKALNIPKEKIYLLPGSAMNYGQNKEVIIITVNGLPLKSEYDRLMLSEKLARRISPLFLGIEIICRVVKAVPGDGLFSMRTSV